ncbi:hypothetical protein CLAFUW4_00960 [Fulvia fulva]|uniref:Uncharacterized protein n=1 Tax=Passalora fulva TaxID=5499 RepID=A0A9Q8P4E5_PASFU|nr:uncharacterized protein CLAFUR5_00966 [Fulvia fulva]KAK4634633.1 hypothetical protein CLAFUR4_00961 [Fulvia fulva]KAK4636396.1 hypothetical protein CLAFUR0_00962 [Fulvia fulva]UJO12898.1 hypothetical protein CLAFUR5_00966 [Fulvia fulva]WPV09694.1 hypothetical protein CLAFUW4_00960 [Fulvia fulva]WPV23972.1 hypothetical protein CLAFUW7_00856 [Fulvia fulva]
MRMGTYFLSQDPKEPRYEGLPDAEIDQSWHDLLNKRFIDLSPEEADEESEQPRREEDWVFGRFWITTNSHHALHCLDYVWRSLSPTYYGIEDTPAAPFVMSHRMHLDSPTTVSPS